MEVPRERLAHWATAYDEVLRFSKWHKPKPGSVFDDGRAVAYRKYLGEMRRYLGVKVDG